MSMVGFSDSHAGGTAEQAADNGSNEGEDTAPAVKRINLTIPRALDQRLKELMRKTYLTSVTEVIRNALTVYAALAEYHFEGKEIIVRDPKSGKETQLAIFI